MNTSTENPVQRVLCAAVAGALALTLAACNQKPSAEKVGQQIDRSIENANRQFGQQLDQAGNVIADKTAEAGKAVDDGAVVAKVKSALFAEPGLSSSTISVDAAQGVVTLNGVAKSYSDRDRAVQVALNVEGVKSVKNNLVIPARS